MASTYSNIKIQLMATGENSGTWGNVTNVNLGTALEQAIVETATVDVSGGDATLSLSDSNARQDARALRLNVTGASVARVVNVPAIEKAVPCKQRRIRCCNCEGIRSDRYFSPCG